MANKIIRPNANMPVFASTADSADLKNFGTEVASTDITTLLTNSNAVTGWASGVDSSGFPALEWFNAVGHTLSYITSLYLQDGITDWNANQSYYINSQAKSTVNGFTYISKTGTAPSTPNPGTTDPSADSTNWRLAFLDSANTVTYTPSADYHPAPKKYVDDSISALGISGILTVDNFFHAQDQKTSGTSGGTSSSGFQTRTLNTVLANTIAGASLSSNEVILPAGVYYVEASSPLYDTNSAQLTVRNVSDVTDLIIGTSQYSHPASPSSLRTFATGLFTLGATKNIDLNQYVESAIANGLGIRAASGKVEVYSDVKIWKVG